MIITATQEGEYLTQNQDLDISQRVIEKGLITGKNGSKHWRKATEEEIEAVKAYRKQQEEMMKNPDVQPNP